MVSGGPGEDPAAGNARAVGQELAWLEAAVDARFARHARRRSGEAEGLDALPPPPPLERSPARYPDLIHRLDLGKAERLVLALAVAPHVAPDLLDPFLLRNEATGRRFSEFGGWAGQSHAGFLPTAQTALFLLAGRDGRDHFAHRRLFSRDHPLFETAVLSLDHRHGDEPPMSAALRLTPESVERLLAGGSGDPTPGHDFPAQRITTPLAWEDLVLDPAPRQQIEMIGRWIRHADTLLRDWGLGRRLKPGYRCLFHGPPGTGKTLTACLLGKRHGLPVYRVDLSQVVSKWIGETEKNLAGLFDRARHGGWILVFDEADALFGKRGEARTANDRSANQQIAYLLQRIEDFPGLVILATNQRAHMDEAFNRRFQSQVLFPMPSAPARLALWRDTFRNERFTLDPAIDFAMIAAAHEVSGGAIVNVLRHAALMAVERDPPTVLAADLVLGLRQELQKNA